MSSLLDAVNVEPNKIEVTDQLPSRVGDVSIMTISQAFVALANSNNKYNTFCHHHDPNPGWGYIYILCIWNCRIRRNKFNCGKSSSRRFRLV